MCLHSKKLKQGYKQMCCLSTALHCNSPHCEVKRKSGDKPNTLSPFTSCKPGYDIEETGTADGSSNVSSVYLGVSVS